MNRENQPLVSVIMGIYNCEKTLAQAVESILEQTYENWELIMCDDGSSDDTFRIAKEYSEADSRVIVLRNDRNRRLAFTLNHCLQHAKGKYIARMDADDASMPERLEKEVAFLEENPQYAVVGTGRYIFDDTGVLCVRMSEEFPQGPETWSTTPFAHPTIMMRKECYDALGGYTVSADTMRAEDLDLWFRFHQMGLKGYNMQLPLYRYREGLEDYAKRSVRAAVHTAKLRKSWHRKLKISRKYDFLWMKPVISSLIPARILEMYHTRRK